MANTVYTVEVVKLQNGEEIELHPNPIARQRKFMVRLGEGTLEGDDNGWGMMLDLIEISLQKRYPELVADREELEEALDEPTAFKILELTGGIKLDDPKLIEAALAAMETTTEKAGTN